MHYIGSSVSDPVFYTYQTSTMCRSLREVMAIQTKMDKKENGKKNKTEPTMKGQCHTRRINEHHFLKLFEHRSMFQTENPPLPLSTHKSVKNKRKWF